MAEESGELLRNVSADHTALKGLRPIKERGKRVEEEK